MTVKTIVALFDDFDDAQAAVNDLNAAGIAQSQISIVANDYDRSRLTSPGDTAAERTATARDTRHESQAGTGAGAGATIGAVLGGGGGLLAGLGLMAIPGIGPVVAAGPLVAALTGAGAGAAAGGIIGGLVGLGIPEEEAHSYAEGVRRGGTLVTVRAEEAETDRITDILERHNPVDVDERGRDWRSSGWSRFEEANATPYPADDIARDRERYRGMFGAAGAASTKPPGTGADVTGTGLSGNAGMPGTPSTSTATSAAAGTATGAGMSAGTGSYDRRRTRTYNVGARGTGPRPLT